MIQTILSTLFPPDPSKLGRLWIEEPGEFDEQGSVGPVRPRKYRDGIERTFAEQELG